jgi:predicted nucleic acid-binding protein
VYRILLDAGPLVALLSERETHHGWTEAQFARWMEPCAVCEPVLTEAFHLLGRVRGGQAALRSALREGLIVLDFELKSELATVMDLMDRYSDVPMSHADACLVRMAEMLPAGAVIPKPVLAAFQHTSRDGSCPPEATLLRPPQEASQVIPATRHGARRVLPDGHPAGVFVHPQRETIGSVSSQSIRPATSTTTLVGAAQAESPGSVVSSGSHFAAL